MGSSEDITQKLEEGHDLNVIAMTKQMRLVNLTKRMQQANDPFAEEMTEAMVDHVVCSAQFAVKAVEVMGDLMLQLAAQQAINTVQDAMRGVGNEQSNQPPPGIDGESRPGEL